MVVVYFIAFYFIINACNIYVLRDEQLTYYHSLAVCGGVTWPGLGGWDCHKMVLQ
jgi:hypothetical protein